MHLALLARYLDGDLWEARLALLFPKSLCRLMNSTRFPRSPAAPLPTMRQLWHWMVRTV